MVGCSDPLSRIAQHVHASLSLSFSSFLLLFWMGRTQGCSTTQIALTTQSRAFKGALAGHSPWCWSCFHAFTTPKTQKCFQKGWRGLGIASWALGTGFKHTSWVPAHKLQRVPGEA